MAFKRFKRWLEEMVNEPSLYHHTSVDNAHSILKDKKFRLSTGVGTGADRDERVPSTHYFLSTSRNRTGDYARHNSHHSGAMFQLNRNHIAAQHKIQPKDYWGREMHSKATTPDRHREQEDRVISHKPHIDMGKNPRKYIHSVHILHDFSKENHSSELDKNRNAYTHANVRGLMLHAKKHKIPVHLYTDKKHYLTGNTKKAVPFHQVKHLLRGTPESRPDRMNRDYLKHYRELHHATDHNKLSKRAKDHLSNFRHDARSMEADLHNAAKSSNPSEKHGLHKTVQVMRKVGAKTPDEFRHKMLDKWHKIRGY